MSYITMDENISKILDEIVEHADLQENRVYFWRYLAVAEFVIIVTLIIILGWIEYAAWTVLRGYPAWTSLLPIIALSMTIPIYLRVILC